MCWINSFQRQVRVRKKAILEVLEWIRKIQTEEIVDLEVELPLSITISLFYRISSIIETNGDEKKLTKHRSGLMP